jgi:hypothetical protein
MTCTSSAASRQTRGSSPSPAVLANQLGLDTDAGSTSYIVGWSHTHPATFAGNVLRAVNTIPLDPASTTRTVTRPGS